MDEASNCTRVGMMHKGRIIADGDPRKLVTEAGKGSLEDAFLYYSRTAKKEQNMETEGTGVS